MEGDINSGGIEVDPQIGNNDNIPVDPPAIPELPAIDNSFPPPSQDDSMDVAPMEPFSVPSPISPNIIRSNSVDPPEGLLSSGYHHITPPSSQPTIPSPSLGNQRLLAVPFNNPNATAGPVTRSRSRFRSPAPHLPTNMQRRRSSVKKPDSSKTKLPGRRR